MTLEALLLHYADDIDAKFNHVSNFILDSNLNHNLQYTYKSQELKLKEDMKKIALTMFTFLITSGFVFAGGMGCSGYKQEILADRTTQEIIETLEDFKDFDLAQAVSYAIEQRPEIRQQRKRIDNAEIEVEYSRNQLLPDVRLNVFYGSAALAGVARSLPVDPITGYPIGGSSPVITSSSWEGATVLAALVAAP